MMSLLNSQKQSMARLQSTVRRFGLSSRGVATASAKTEGTGSSGGGSPGRLPPLPSIGDILRMYNIRAAKALSQNFIMDPRILDGIAGHARVEGKHVVEVGPGPGGITRALIKAGAKKVHVIEKDPRFLPSLNLLKDCAGPGKLEVHMGDCLSFNVENMFPEEVRVPWDSDHISNLVLVGNLPFNVATPFFLKLIRAMDDRSNYYSWGKVSAVLTFQQEVALRMCAPPGDPQRSRLSVITQNYLEVDQLMELPGGAFVPPPKVSVGLVKMVPHHEPFIKDLPFHFVNKVVTGLFLNKNQKYLNSIRTNLIPVKLRDDVMPVLADSIGIRESKTPIELSMEEISRICHAYKILSDIVLTEKEYDLEMWNGFKAQIANKMELVKIQDFQKRVTDQHRESKFDIQLM